MGKCLLLVIFIALLTSSISANTKNYCKSDSEYKICGYGDTITFINGTALDLRLDVNTFSAIAPYAFRKKNIDTLSFYSLSPHNCNPKVVDSTRKSFEGSSVNVLELQCMKFEVKQNPFINLTSISTLTLERVELMGNMSEFFTPFRHLRLLKLRNFNITTISPDIFSGINKDLKHLNIEGNINAVEPKSFEQFHNLTELRLSRSQLVELRSDIFYGLTQLSDLHLLVNEIKVLRRHTFKEVPQIRNLALNYSKIRKIESETFSGLNLKSLTLIGNILKNLPVGVFQNLRNLEILDLSFNKIRTVPYNVFEGCVSLEKLYFHYNEIYYIEPTAFWGLNLHELWLKHNQLTVLQHDAFIGLRVQNLLDLRSNNIGKIEPQAFRNLTATRIILCWHNISQVDKDSWGVIGKIENNHC